VARTRDFFGGPEKPCLARDVVAAAPPSGSDKARAQSGVALLAIS
jgi:hypothetical protein